jgi:RNA polymerase sigma factor (TIGR02999 family)
MSEITQLLQNLDSGDKASSDHLLDLVYHELRSLASAKLGREKGYHTLQATALVHDAWLRLGGDQPTSWKNRAHFFGAAAEAMRRILIERARKKRTQRQGGGQGAIPIDGIEIECPSDFTEDGLAVHEALEKFADSHPEKAELVKLRFFVGLTTEQTASALGIAVPTVKRWWKFSKAWLRVEMAKMS